jgi:hypothetical protein
MSAALVISGMAKLTVLVLAGGIIELITRRQAHGAPASASRITTSLIPFRSLANILSVKIVDRCLEPRGLPLGLPEWPGAKRPS